MLRNSFINYIAYNRPHSYVSSSTGFLEGVSYIFNQIRKKCTKLEKNIPLFVHLSAEKCTNVSNLTILECKFYMENDFMNIVHKVSNLTILECKFY